LFCFVFSQQQLADGVLAVVGDKIILNSSVLEESFFRAQQEGLDPSLNPGLFRDLFSSVLKERIQRAVVVSAAERDTSVSVSYNDIDKNLDIRIDFFINQIGSIEALEREMGLSLEEIKSKYWEEIKEELLISSFQRSLFGGVYITREEVLSFYKTKKDSLPKIPSLSTFSLVEQKVSPSQESVDVLLLSMVGLRDSLVSGLLDFGEVAKKRSLDPSAVNNLGKITSLRGDLLPSYEKAAFALSVGEISQPVLTKYGYHLIKLLEVVGEKTTTQHVLFEKKASSEDFLRAQQQLNSLKTSTFNDPGMFDSLAFVYKQKNNNLSGLYEGVDISLFPFEVGEFFLKTENFSFSEVFAANGSCFVLYRYSFQEEKESTLEENWRVVENLALEHKRKLLFDLWIEEQYEKVYVKINPIY